MSMLDVDNIYLNFCKLQCKKLEKINKNYI